MLQLKDAIEKSLSDLRFKCITVIGGGPDVRVFESSKERNSVDPFEVYLYAMSLLSELDGAEFDTLEAQIHEWYKDILDSSIKLLNISSFLSRNQATIKSSSFANRG